MQEFTVTTNGITRTIEGKRIGNEFRIYRVLGDVASPGALGELAQDIALAVGAERITFR